MTDDAEHDRVRPARASRAPAHPSATEAPSAHFISDIRLEDMAWVGPVAIRHINFTGVLNFPPEEFAETLVAGAHSCAGSA